MSDLPDAAAALNVLQQVPDPEVPALSIVELGIIRGVEIDAAAAAICVRLTPTYSGCPAMAVIEASIVEALTAAGFSQVSIQRVFNPPWTTDDIGPEARQKLTAYGIAPPDRTSPQELMPLAQLRRRLSCPFCGSTQTHLESEFGATACKAFYFCDSCQQPFEHFKAI